MEVEQSGKDLNKVKPTAAEIREEVKPIANRFIKQIAMFTNNKYVDGARMTAAVGLVIAERIILNVSSHLGSEEGEKFISSVYDAAKRDALEQWQINKAGG